MPMVVLVVMAVIVVVVMRVAVIVVMLMTVVMVCMPVARSRERPRQSKFQACSAIVVPSPKTESMSARQSS